jgi:tetratricopeptide (TPR) repeat protein
MMLFYIGIIIITVGIGMVVGLSLIPAIGDKVGAFFYNPDEEIEKDPHADAIAEMAQGNYVGAIKEYFRAYDKNPLDTHALSEIAHIYCDKLGDPEAASVALEEALKKEWPPEQGVFLWNRLVDVYWSYQKDALRAREVLIGIAENLPETKYAANAQHRLNEIDRELANAVLHTHPKQAEAGADQAPS